MDWVSSWFPRPKERTGDEGVVQAVGWVGPPPALLGHFRPSQGQGNFSSSPRQGREASDCARLIASREASPGLSKCRG